LSKSDFTVPKARIGDSGYLSFKRGYIRGAQRLDEEASGFAKQVLGRCEKDRSQKDRTIMTQSICRRHGNTVTSRAAQNAPIVDRKSRSADSDNWRKRS
jgi:hypothetical protein